MHCLTLSVDCVAQPAYCLTLSTDCLTLSDDCVTLAADCFTLAADTVFPEHTSEVNCLLFLFTTREAQSEGLNSL